MRLPGADGRGQYGDGNGPRDLALTDGPHPVFPDAELHHRTEQSIRHSVRQL